MELWTNPNWNTYTFSGLTRQNIAVQNGTLAVDSSEAPGRRIHAVDYRHDLSDRDAYFCHSECAGIVSLRGY